MKEKAAVYYILLPFDSDKFRASVFDRTKDGSTLMHIAALNGHPETAMVSPALKLMFI
jgi:hypothetical protein